MKFLRWLSKMGLRKKIISGVIGLCLIGTVSVATIVANINKPDDINSEVSSSSQSSTVDNTSSDITSTQSVVSSETSQIQAVTSSGVSAVQQAASADKDNSQAVSSPNSTSLIPTPMTAKSKVF